MGLWPGVVALNALFLVLGYALWRSFGGAVRAHDAGIALLLGAGVAAGGVFLATMVGARANLATLGVVAAITLVCAGGVARLRLPRVVAQRRAVRAPELAAGAALAAISALAVVGGFRSSPWLDDAWGIWLPKGVALLHLGLDERLFAADSRYVHFEVPDYPLWWSTLAALDVRAVGDVDARVLNAQLGLLAVAFLAASLRLLWEVARPWLAIAGVGLVALSPEFFRHAQGGVADLALAVYLGIATLAGIVWLKTRVPAYLLLAATLAAVASQIKTEGFAEVALVAAAGVLAARSRSAALAAGAALAAAIPWFAWQATHDVPARTPLGEALDPGHLAGRAERVGPTLREVGERLLDPTDWAFVVPLLAIVAFASAVRSRSAAPLAPLGLVGALAAFVVWAYWSNRDELDFLLATSAYRVVDPLVLTAAVLLPPAAERLLRYSRGS